MKNKANNGFFKDITKSKSLDPAKKESFSWNSSVVKPTKTKAMGTLTRAKEHKSVSESKNNLVAETTQHIKNRRGE